MSNEIIFISPGWWEVGATIIAGLLTAFSTFGAVIYTNNRTKKQLKEQADNFEKVRKDEFKQSKYVLIKFSLMLQTFSNILDRLIVNNDYNRILLFSGEDGFDFYDDFNKLLNQKCRILQIENNSDVGIKDIIATTNTELRNLDTDSVYRYSTKNEISFLRSYEKIMIRLTNQEQFENIIDMNKNSIQSLLNFICKIEYSTLANQRITYAYEIEIRNDRRIEIKKDGIESIVDFDDAIDLNTSIFRNLQDSISVIDRSDYSWEKMGKAQMRDMMTQFSQQSSQEINTNTTQPHDEHKY